MSICDVYKQLLELDLSSRCVSVKKQTAFFNGWARGIQDLVTGDECLIPCASQDHNAQFGVQDLQLSSGKTQTLLMPLKYLSISIGWMESSIQHRLPMMTAHWITPEWEPLGRASLGQKTYSSRDGCTGQISYSLVVSTSF